MNNEVPEGFVGRGTKEKGATFSLCGTYRYKLWRVWDDRPQMLMIGLNPSTADETHDDATIRKVVRFAQRERCGGITMMNLYAFRATDPNVMLAASDPVGPMNLSLLEAASMFHTTIVAAWGVRGGKQADVVRALFQNKRPQCFGLTKEGHPKHPLYLPYRTPLVPYESPEVSE